MPPQKKQKSPKAKKEDAERLKRILSAQEKVLSIKRLLLSIIEGMIEKDISKEWFLENCIKLCHADYDDVVQERSIERLCGYPLCPNTIKQTIKQKYQISVVTNKVYDLTERKCFCSNQCYKASKYLKAQLSPIPLYMRKEEKITVYLLSDCDNKGSVGEEIIFHQTIPPEEIEKVYDEEQTSTNLYNMLNEDVKKCADSLIDLQIKEHVFEKQFVFEEETPKKSDSSLCKDNRESDSDDDDVDSDDSIDEKLFPSHDNTEVSSHRQMPIPKKIKKSVLIPPLKTERTPSTAVQKLSLDFVYKVFKDWMTEDTMKFLLGEKHVYGIKADSLFKEMTSDDPINPEKLSSIKDEYIKLCLKIDSLPDGDDEEDDLYDSVDFGIVCESETSPVSKKLESEDSTEKKVFKKRPKGKSKAKNKHVTFAPDVKNPVQETKPQLEDKKDVPVLEDKTLEESPADRPLPEPALPLIDSVSQNILRRQVLTGHLKSVYSELLPIIGLHYTDVREGIRKFVETLSLTPSNITFKPKEWKLISLVLYRILTKTVSKKLHNELQFLKMCEGPFIPISIDILELEKIVLDLLSTENIINLK